MFPNALFCTCIPILFLCFSCPCVYRILQFKGALTDLLHFQIGVKENSVCYVLLLPCSHTPHLRCTIDRSVHCSRDPPLQTSFCHLRSSSPLPASTPTALPSPTEQMNLRTTQFRKRGC